LYICVKEENKPRQKWSIARVQRLVKGRDGKVRAAAIKVHDKRGNIIQMYRPLQKLFPIELESRETSKEVPITFVQHAEQENIN